MVFLKLRLGSLRVQYSLGGIVLWPFFFNAGLKKLIRVWI